MKDFGGGIFTTTTAVVRRKKAKKITLSWAKNTARGVRFLIRFNMYLIWVQCEQVYLFLGRALSKTTVVVVKQSQKTGPAAPKKRPVSLAFLW